MISFFFYLMAFALLLGALIVVHELGHYLVARWAGVKVLRFSVGFGRPVMIRRFGKDRTEWAIGLFPLGGYVRMLDESEGEVAPHEIHRSFNRQSVGKRMAIVAAGPLANLLLAVVVYWGLFMVGVEELRPVLGAPVASSSAAHAGIENGERVLKIGGEPIETWSQMRWHLLKSMVAHDTVELEVVNSRSEINWRRIDLSAARDAEGDDPIARLGIRFFRPVVRPGVGSGSQESPAEMAGLLAGDEIVGVNGQPIESWSDFVQVIRSSPDVPLQLEVLRGGQYKTLAITPREIVDDKGERIGRIGAAVRDDGRDRSALFVTVRHGFLPALGKALTETWDQSVFSVRMMAKMVTGSLSLKNISGPVTIADYAGKSAQLGVGPYLKFLALVSISLAILNLLPIPVLDGGHLLYYLAELIRGSPLPEQYMVIGQKVGLALLLMLMAFAFYNDLTRLIPG
jgi:regulator of sigma E protease